MQCFLFHTEVVLGIRGKVLEEVASGKVGKVYNMNHKEEVLGSKSYKVVASGMEVEVGTVSELGTVLVEGKVAVVDRSV